jgi:hypothetical protein
MLHVVEVLGSNDKWFLWQDGIKDEGLPLSVFNALRLYGKVRVDGRTIFTREG